MGGTGDAAFAADLASVQDKIADRLAAVSASNGE
jgi:hypothetical protein